MSVLIGGSDVGNPWDSFAAYDAWRATKCPDLHPSEQRKNAALGLCGEVAELTVDALGDSPFADEGRDNLIDEAGDVLFYAVWVRSACGEQAEMFHGGPEGMDAGADVTLDIPSNLADLKTYAGLVAEAVKKAEYHAKPERLTVAWGHSAAILVLLSDFLKSIGSSLAEAMRRNVEKLDRRYENGFVPGGGNR